MKRINVVQCQLVKEKSMAYEYKAINSPSSAASLLKSYIGNPDREVCVLACLDTKHNVNALHTISIGTLNASCVHPREVFKVAILANSDAIIIAHNHPSGNPTPSNEDIKLTRQLAEAGKLLGIQLLDHIILGDDDNFISLRDEGLM